MIDIFDYLGMEGMPTFKFNTPLKDMRPSYLKTTDTGYQVLVKCLGIKDVTL